MPAQTVIKIRRDTQANWDSVNPVLGSGEIAFETDTSKIKVGDGTSTWSQLDYASGAGTAAEITTDTTNFDGLLSGFDTTVQSALETLDDFEIPPGTTTSVSPPATPEAGQLWWNSETGTLFIYYDGFWVEAAPQVAGPSGADGEAFNNVDGGEPGTNYTGIEPIDAGGV